MNRPEREVLERLGRAGLARVLDDLLDPARLLRVAQAAGVSYPGIRLQSQKRERILADLTEKALQEAGPGRGLVRALRKQTASEAKAWTQLTTEARVASLEAPEASGREWFLAASAAAEPGVEEALVERVAVSPESAPPGPVRPSSDDTRGKEVARLRKKAAELQKKLRHLEAQAAKYRETEKSLKRDVIQRKGEIAEARMLVERLRRELEESKGSSPAAAPSPPPRDPALDEIGRTLKRVAADQRKLAHRVDELVEAGAAPPAEATLPQDALAPLVEALAESTKELSALRRERRKDVQETARRLDEMHGAIAAAREAAESSPRLVRSAARRRGDPERVGVFVDVQNMYYAARQLKGKLDFDALLEAAVLDRRLIQATAYVVESKEIDQSGFIARLQQRAIEVRRKSLQIRADGSMKGDWDMEIALDILDTAPKLDVVVLVSGDGDFTALVKRVKGLGPRVEVVAFPRNTAKSLIEAADRFTPLDRKFMIRTEPAASETPEPAAAG